MSKEEKKEDNNTCLIIGSIAFVILVYFCLNRHS